MAEEKIKDEKPMNMNQKTLADLETAANEIFDYYGKFGVIGAGDFIKAGASWNFEGVTRPFQRNR